MQRQLECKRELLPCEIPHYVNTEAVSRVQHLGQHPGFRTAVEGNRAEFQLGPRFSTLDSSLDSFACRRKSGELSKVLNSCQAEKRAGGLCREERKTAEIGSFHRKHHSTWKCSDASLKMKQLPPTLSLQLVMIYDEFMQRVVYDALNFAWHLIQVMFPSPNVCYTLLLFEVTNNIQKENAKLF